MAQFTRRPYPSANSVLLDGGVLVDPGAFVLPEWLGTGRPALVVNTHWHSDHAGANAALQARGTPVAAEASEAAVINAGDRDAGRGWFLRQRIEPYRVDVALRASEEVAAGRERWTVLALPGHSAAQIGFWNAAERVLLCADALMADDIGWLDLDASPAALEDVEATVESIARLGARLLLPGHGAAITDAAAALGNARRRLASWRAEPERIAWHASKRIFTHALMLEDGLDAEEVAGYLLASPWFGAQARRGFGAEPAAFVPVLVAEMVRSGAACWREGRLLAAGCYRLPK